MDSRLRIGAIFDRDYWPDEELIVILNDLNEHIEFAHIHTRKEIENYLLIPTVIDRVIRTIIVERNIDVTFDEDISSVLRNITEKYKNDITAQFISKRINHYINSKLDRSTITSEALQILEDKWSDIDKRLEIVPGKKVLGEFKGYLQIRYGFTLTDFRIIEEMTKDEIPSDIRDMIKQLDTFIKS